MTINLKHLKDKKLLLNLFFIVGILWILVSFLSKLSFPETSYNFLGTSGKAKLNPGAPITQVFTAKENNLNQVKVIFKNTNIRPGEKIAFTLTDENCERTIAEDTYHFYSSSPSIYYRLKFPEISNSANQKYCLKVTYFSPFDRGDNRPYLVTTEDETLFSGWSYTNTGNGRTYENRTLQMRPSYGTGSFLGDLERLIDRLSQYKPGFIKGFPITLLALATLFGSIGLGFWIIFSKDRE